MLSQIAHLDVLDMAVKQLSLGEIENYHWSNFHSNLKCICLFIPHVNLNTTWTVIEHRTYPKEMLHFVRHWVNKTQPQ